MKSLKKAVDGLAFLGAIVVLSLMAGGCIGTSKTKGELRLDVKRCREDGRFWFRSWKSCEKTRMTEAEWGDLFKGLQEETP